MATTTNFGWETPDDTDLVKDGALAIRTLGNSIDTSLVDLKGGTTGQVLSKTSNTDMDFTWVSASSGPTFVGCSLSDTNANGQSISNNTYTALTWNQEDYDTDGFHSTSTNTDRITIPSGKGGKYEINAIVNWGSNTSGQRVLKIYKNGSSFKGGGVSPAAGYPGNVVTCTINLVAGDYVSVYVFQNSGSTQDAYKADDSGHFSATYLGA